MELADVRAAARLIAPHTPPTPLVRVPESWLPSPETTLFLKREDCQRSGSFKGRGALHFLTRLAAEGLVRGVVTYSSGNHGRAVAEAAAALGVSALVAVPDAVDPSKEAAIRAAGAEVVHAGPTSASRREAGERAATERGWSIVPPFDHEWIVAGQGSLTLEILEELRQRDLHLDGLWVPVGGGGLASGQAVALAEAAPAACLHTVEPAGASCLARSVAVGERVALEESASVADGLLPLAVGDLNWRILSAAASSSPPRLRTHTVADDVIVNSLRRLRLDLGIPSEPSGAVAAAPFLAPDAEVEVPGGVHVAVVSGGNVDSARLTRLIE